MSQQTVLVASADKFKINPTYYESLPRPTYDELRALRESIIVNGQMVPIIVNNNMVILDGHTRYDVLSNMGLPIKYIIREFADIGAEHLFVVETNIMRRNLNPFQKIEAMYVFYKKEREKKRISLKSAETIHAMLTAIKNGCTGAREIAAEVGVDVDYARHTLTKLTNEYYVSREKLKGDGFMYHGYVLLPKAEELLAKDLRWKSKLHISRLIGVSKNTLEKGVYLIENADGAMLNNLRSGTMHISTAYNYMLGTSPTGYRKGNKYLNRYSKTMCPHCKKTVLRKDWLIPED